MKILSDYFTIFKKNKMTEINPSQLLPKTTKENQETSHLQEYLTYYLTLTAPGYAVLVTGDWGSGKTYQVKTCIPEEKYLYVSLFGVQTIEQLHSEVFAANSPSLAKLEKAVGKGSEVIAGMQGPWALAGAAPGLFNAVFKRQIESTKTLIFDDLERSGLSLKEVIGAINSYVEHLNFKVIVIAHDEQLASEFISMKEKTFGQTIRVEPQVEAALSQFIEDIINPLAKEFANEFRPQIQGTFLYSGVKSLRVLRHAIEDLTRLHNSLTEKHRTNRPAMEDLIKFFLALQIEVRSGLLQESDLRNRRGIRYSYLLRTHAKKDAPPETPKLVIADDKYPTINLEDDLLNDDVLCAMLIDGRFPAKKIQESIDNSQYFIVPEEVSPWKTVIHFDNLDDDIVQEAVKRMNRQFDDRSVTDSGELLHIFCLRMVMSKENIIGKDINLVVKENLAYIDDLLEKGTLPPRGTGWRWYNEFERSYDGFGYWVYPEHRDYFKKTWDHLIKAREEALTRKFPDIAADLLEKIKSNSKEFFELVSPTNNGLNPYAHIPILHTISPDVFVNTWLSSPNENWKDVNFALDNRYNSGELDRGLSEERDWALAVLRELKQRASSEAGFSALRIRRIIPEALKNLEQPRQD